MTHATLEDHDDELLDDAWLSAPRRRSRLRVALLAGLAVATVFLAGVLVQRELGEDTTTTSAGRPNLGGRMPDGLPTDLSGGAAPDGVGSGTAENQATGEDKETSVVGEVVGIDGDKWVIDDLGGTRQTVRIADDATVTTSYAKPAKVEVGATVTVSGEPARDDVVDVHAITVR